MEEGLLELIELKFWPETVELGSAEVDEMSVVDTDTPKQLRFIKKTRVRFLVVNILTSL